MIAFLLVFGVNVLVTVAALIRERGEDPQFEGDKLVLLSIRTIFNLTCCLWGAGQVKRFVAVLLWLCHGEGWYT
jgi:hypothetical protein